ncbi:hypothetical protein C1336_000320077 [Campylobacter jejuni subsp. jejuni 1336]|nr:hypothetical protein C1336_000320077 [Campylobacter jejuni subsp. jejuni 1336]
MFKVDLNSDLEESFDTYKMGMDEKNFKICKLSKCRLWLSCG